MSRITLCLSLIAAFTLTALAPADASASASALPVHCIRDGDTTRCTLSMQQTVEPLLVELFGDPKAQPVPLCLDCAPIEVELLCSITQRKGEAPITRCQAQTEGSIAPR